MMKTIINDGKVYLNGSAKVLGLVAGIGHLGANGLRKAGVSDSETVKNAFLDGYTLPSRGLDMLLDNGKTLTDDEYKALEVQAKAASATSGVPYDVILKGLIDIARS